MITHNWDQATWWIDKRKKKKELLIELEAHTFYYPGRASSRLNLTDDSFSILHVKKWEHSACNSSCMAEMSMAASKIFSWTLQTWINLHRFQCSQMQHSEMHRIYKHNQNLFFVESLRWIIYSWEHNFSLFSSINIHKKNKILKYRWSQTHKKAKKCSISLRTPKNFS